MYDNGNHNIKKILERSIGHKQSYLKPLFDYVLLGNITKA